MKRTVELKGIGFIGSGAAYVAQRQTDGSWTIVERLTSPDGTCLGYSAALAGDRAVVGSLTTKIENLKAAVDRLSPRERRMVGALAATFLAIIVLGIGYWISSSLDEIDERNGSIRKALRLLDKHRTEFLDGSTIIRGVGQALACRA